MTGQPTSERETHLRVESVSDPDSSGALNGGAATSPEASRAETVYFDTPDLHLLRRGATVRFRPGQERVGMWTVELPHDAPATGGSQRAVSTSGRPGGIPAPLEDLVRGWALGASLGPVATLEVAQDGAPSGDQIPELERALGRSAPAPWDLAPPAVGDDPTAGELITLGLVGSAARLVDHLALVVLDEDPEGVHQARVGIRRLRSDLKTAKPLLHYKAVRPVRRELDWLMDQLGAVRDLDVLVARLRRDSRAFNPEDRAGAEALITAALEERAQAHERLRAALRTERCGALLQETARLAASPPFRSGAAGRPAADVLPGLVRGPLKDLRREVKAQGRTPDAAGLHRIRIAAKRVRYAAELAAPAAGPKAKQAARGMARVQTVLGDHNDAIVAEARLRELGARTGDARAWAAGLFGGLQLARAARRRERFPKVWAKAAVKKRWRWTKR